MGACPMALVWRASFVLPQPCPGLPLAVSVPYTVKSLRLSMESSLEEVLDEFLLKQ